MKNRNLAITIISVLLFIFSSTVFAVDTVPVVQKTISIEIDGTSCRWDWALRNYSDVYFLCSYSDIINDLPKSGLILQMTADWPVYIDLPLGLLQVESLDGRLKLAGEPLRTVDENGEDLTEEQMLNEFLNHLNSHPVLLNILYQGPDFTN